MSDPAALARETQMAMFWAALAAQCAGESYVTGSRIVASLLRTRSVERFCARAQIDSARVRDAVDEPHTLSFDECERRVRTELAAQDLEFASREHQAGVRLRPLEPAVRDVFYALLDLHGRLGVPPLELLRDVLRADTALAQRLTPHGVTVDSIGTALEKR